MKKLKIFFKNYLTIILSGIMFLMIVGCRNDDPTIDEDLVMPSTAKDILVKAQEDWQNINDALQNAGSGEVVQLAEGLFYLNKSIVIWDYNGTFKGSGMEKTIIHTTPGTLFDRSNSPSINWDLESSDGGFMFCFPHNFTGDERTVTVSDLSIFVTEPTTPYLRWKNTDKEKEFNSLEAINVHYINLDKDMGNPIHMNVFFKNITIKGKKDEKYNYNGFSIFHGLSAFGASSGIFEAENVWIENASGCITPGAFYHANSSVTVKDSHLKSCKFGVYSFLNHSWTILNNNVEDCYQGIVLLKKNVGGDLVEGPEGSTFVKNNKIKFNGGLGLGVQFVNNVQVNDNIFEGSGKFGAIAGVKGSNWIIKDNDLCGVAPIPPFNCTLFLLKLKNSEIKDNANQIIGPKAPDLSNTIGEGKECH